MKKVQSFLLIAFTIAIGILFGWSSYNRWLNATPERQTIADIVSAQQFDFVRWEGETLLGKVEMALVDGPTYLDQGAEVEVVHDYLKIIAQLNEVNGQLDALYARSADPFTESAPLRAQLTAIREQQAAQQPLAEAILERQISDLLAAQGFSVFPPVQMHNTPLPTMLIISPRDKIEQLYAFPLQPGLSAPEREQIESAVQEATNRSALVVDIGGLALYPAMVIETTDLAFLTDTIAHEWAHHWLAFRPLGLRYASDDAQMRVINETVASIFGTEMGRIALETYYADYLHESAVRQRSAKWRGAEKSPFDFNAEMRQTRIEVDRLLAEGKFEGAERYMETRRQLFISNGYLVRKLNQAYFAFHGAYADQPGAGGADPIGPAVITLRQQSDSLYQFMQTAAQIKSWAELESLLK